MKDRRRKLGGDRFSSPWAVSSCLVVSQRCEPRLQHCPSVHSLTAWQWLLLHPVAVAPVAVAHDHGDRVAPRTRSFLRQLVCDHPLGVSVLYCSGSHSWGPQFRASRFSP